jgi:hypothetical protein
MLAASYEHAASAQSMQLQLVAVWGVLVIINEKNKQAP